MVTKDASSKILGFLYQMQRALYRIFSCETDNTVIGIETADDVVEEIRFKTKIGRSFSNKISIQSKITTNHIKTAVTIYGTYSISGYFL
jgi:hypothetical protein